MLTRFKLEKVCEFNDLMGFLRINRRNVDNHPVDFESVRNGSSSLVISRFHHSSLEKFVKTKRSSHYMKQFDEFSRGLTSVTLIIIDPVESVQNWSSSLVPVPELCRPLFFSVCDAANERRS